MKWIKKYAKELTTLAVILGIMFTCMSTFATKEHVKDIFNIVFNRLDRMETKIDKILERL